MEMEDQPRHDDAQAPRLQGITYLFINTRFYLGVLMSARTLLPP